MKINGKEVGVFVEVEGELVTSDATATAADIAKDKTAYVNGEKVTGTHECDSGLDTSDATATAETILAGVTAYVDGEKVTGTMPEASAPTPSVSVSSAGLITASVDNPKGYQPSATTKSATEQLTTRGQQVITPGTANQYIYNGQYLTGTQIIQGDANLLAENIKEGVSIFGVAGTLAGAVGTSSGTLTLSSGASTLALTHNLGENPNFLYFTGTVGNYTILGFWFEKDGFSANYLYYMTASSSAINNSSSWHLVITQSDVNTMYATMYRDGSTPLTVSSADISWIVGVV